MATYNSNTTMAVSGPIFVENLKSRSSASGGFTYNEILYTNTANSYAELNLYATGSGSSNYIEFSIDNVIVARISGEYPIYNTTPLDPYRGTITSVMLGPSQVLRAKISFSSGAGDANASVTGVKFTNTP